MQRSYSISSCWAWSKSQEPNHQGHEGTRRKATVFPPIGCFRVIPALGLDDLAAAQAGGANAHALGSGANFGVDRAQVDVPAPLAHVVGVTDRVAAHRLLAANLTNLCHRTALQNLSELGVQNIDCTGFERVSTMAQGPPTNANGPDLSGPFKSGTYSTLRRIQYKPRKLEIMLLLTGGYPCVPYPRTHVPMRNWTRRDANPHPLPSQGAVFPLHHVPR